MAGTLQTLNAAALRWSRHVCQKRWHSSALSARQLKSLFPSDAVMEYGSAYDIHAILGVRAMLDYLSSWAS